jgi:alpha-L-fucosidase
MSGKHIIAALQHGDPNGSVWRPAEADTSIRPGWFHHPAEDARVRTADQLVALYFRSVGRNAKLLLNVPPTKEGILHPTDVERLMTFADRRRALFAERVRHEDVRVTFEGTRRIDTFTFKPEANVGTIRIEEPIQDGQFATSFVVSRPGDRTPWTEVARGQTIGHARIVDLGAERVRQLRVEVEGTRRVTIRLFAPVIK